MKIIKFVFITTSMLLLYSGLYAQTGLNTFSYSMIYLATGEIRHTQTLIDDGQHRITDRYDSIYKRICVVDLPSAELLSKIHVYVGSVKDSSDVFSYSFSYNDSLNLTLPINYSSEGNRLYLGLFDTIQTDMYYYKVWLEGTDGVMYEPRYFY